MTQIKRKMLFLIFLAAFCVLTPYMILYASGYQLDWNHPLSPLMIQKTGMAIVYSEPAGAFIYLNDKKQKTLNFSLNFSDNTIKTPAKIKNLLPGSYELRVERTGYWPWSRRIVISPGQITHILDVDLFRKDLPMLIANAPMAELYPAPNLKKVLIGGENNLIDLKSEQGERLAASSGPALWSGDGSKLILGGQVINLKDQTKNFSIDKTIGGKIGNLKWPDGDSKEIFYQYKQALNRFDLDKKINSVVAENEDILDYTSKGDNLFYIAQNGFSAKLKNYSLSGKKIKGEVELPPSDGYTFLNGRNGWLNVYDSKYKILYLVDPSSQINPLLEIINDAKYFQWFDDQTLFYANDSEIWLLDIKNDERRLLLRWSEPLKGIVKTKNDNYLFFYTDSSLKVLTWDKGDEKLQVTEMMKLEKITAPFLSENENTLYFFGKIGSQEGLYKMTLK